ncbi:MAG TPA: hypothetical protein VG245_02195 [Candidatus Dormibacteraeota bacterium]|nr:hypothetical protein [Candidatus Dormibacteraeota bacterium]
MAMQGVGAHAHGIEIGDHVTVTWSGSTPSSCVTYVKGVWECDLHAQGQVDNCRLALCPVTLDAQITGTWSLPPGGTCNDLTVSGSGQGILTIQTGATYVGANVVVHAYGGGWMASYYFSGGTSIADPTGLTDQVGGVRVGEQYSGGGSIDACGQVPTLVGDFHGTAAVAQDPVIGVPNCYGGICPVQ